MIEKHFNNWDYSAVQELEQLCHTIPILERTTAMMFFDEARKITDNMTNKVSERQTGKVFDSLQGFVASSDRKDFSVICDLSTQNLTDGILMVETFDSVIPLLFCVARISEDLFLTYGWHKQIDNELIKGLRAISRNNDKSISEEM